MRRRGFSNAVPGNAIVISSLNGELTGILASWQYSASTSAADPGDGWVRFNNATISSATAIYIDDLDAQDNDMSAMLAGLGAASYIQFRSAVSPSDFAIFSISSVTDSTGYYTLSVSHVAGSPSFSASEALAVSFAPSASGTGSGDFLADGSVPMTGDLDFDGNGATNLATINGWVPREVVTANRTYYVRADGSDSNDGLADTSGGAFLTLQKAWNTLASLDLSIYTGKIKVADGTYTAGISTSAMPVAGSSITIEGNTTTPANVHINVSTDCFAFSGPLPCPMSITGFKGTHAGASKTFVKLDAPGTITCTYMQDNGGSTGYAGSFRAGISGALIIISTGCSITASGSCFVQVALGGVVQFYGVTVTLTGTPAFSWVFASATGQSQIIASGVTFSGSATGVRYSATQSGSIWTNGGGASFLPGSSAGSTGSDGFYG